MIFHRLDGPLFYPSPPEGRLGGVHVWHLGTKLLPTSVCRFCVDISSPVLWVSAGECDRWAIWGERVSFVGTAGAFHSGCPPSPPVTEVPNDPRPPSTWCLMLWTWEALTSDGSAVVSHGWCNLRFPGDLVWGILSRACLPSVCLLR